MLFTQERMREDTLTIFVCSTTGQGEAPDNMRNFWSFLLRKGLPADILSHMSYTVFGLGDSSYPGYNVVAKRLDRRLAQLGACPFCERGEGDDQHPLGLDAMLTPWLEGMWTALLATYPLPEGCSILPSTEPLPPRMSVTVAVPASEDGMALEMNNEVTIVRFAHILASPPAAVASRCCCLGPWLNMRPTKHPMSPSSSRIGGSQLRTGNRMFDTSSSMSVGRMT